MEKHVKSFSIIIVITLLCKLLGFVRELALAYYFGTGSVVDTFLMAEQLPSVFFGWTTAFATAFVPVYQGLKTGQDIEKRNSYLSTILLVITVFSALFVAIGLIFANQIVAVGAPGFSEGEKKLTLTMYTVCTLSYLYYSQIQLVSNYLNCHEKFVSASAPTLLISPIQTLFIVFGYRAGNPVFLAAGVAVSIFAQMIVTLGLAVKNGLRLKNRICFSEEIRQTVMMAFPLFLSQIVTRVNALIDKMFASTLAEGSISSLGYGETLRTVFYSIISAVISSMFFPLLSNAVASGDRESAESLISRAIKILILVTVPMTVFGCILSKWGVTIVFLRGSFDEKSVIMTSGAFVMYMVGLLAMLLRDVCNNVAQSFKNTKIPLLVCVFIVVMNIVLNICLIGRWKHIGLALSTSLANILALPLEYVLIRKKFLRIDLKKIPGDFAGTLVCTLAASAVLVIYVSLFRDCFTRVVMPVQFILMMVGLAAAVFIYYFMCRAMHLVPPTAISGIREMIKKRR